MADRNLLLLLYICHVLGDFYLQTSDMSQKKRGNLSFTLYHSAYYGIPFLGLLLLDIRLIVIVVLAVGVHGLIDLLKCRVEKMMVKNPRRKPRITEIQVFVLDQALHFATIYLIVRTLNHKEIGISVYVLAWVLSLLILLKPANISFKILFSRFAPNENEPVSILGAGAVIGSLERILMLLFLVLGQYASVGLIMTAKSIARYDRISKDPVFAEYYLIGTLYSVLLTLVVFSMAFLM